MAWSNVRCQERETPQGDACVDQIVTTRTRASAVYEGEQIEKIAGISTILGCLDAKYGLSFKKDPVSPIFRGKKHCGQCREPEKDCPRESKERGEKQSFNGLRTVMHNFFNPLKDDP